MKYETFRLLYSCCLRQAGYVFIGVWAFVCLFVSSHKIRHKGGTWAKDVSGNTNHVTLPLGSGWGYE